MVSSPSASALVVGSTGIGEQQHLELEADNIFLCPGTGRRISQHR
jgi:hypothetical protein